MNQSQPRKSQPRVISRTIGQCFVILLMSAGILAAQVKNPPSPNPADEKSPASVATSLKEEVVQLDAFSVESDRDYGYRATNSITATGSGAAVRDTPMSIVILTEEYIKDKNLLDLQEAVRNISSITAEAKEENVFISRGFQSVLKVNGDEVEAGFDLANAERVEVIKGAVSVLQGRSSAGGVINVINRRPKMKQQAKIDATYGSYGYYRARLMTTGPLVGKKLAYLIGYSKSDRPDGWSDYTYRREDSWQAALTFHPIETLSMTVDYQNFVRGENHAQHMTFTHPAFLASELEAAALYDAKGLARPAQYPRRGEATRAWLNRTPGFGTAAPADVVDVMELMYPRGYRSNIAGPEQFRDNKNWTLAGDLKWRIAERLDWKSSLSFRDSTTENLNWNTFRVAGGLVMTTRPFRQLVYREGIITRHEAVGRFDVLGGKHRVLVGFEYQQRRTASQNLQAPNNITYNPRTDPIRNLQAEIWGANPGGFTIKPVDYKDGRPVRAYYIMEQASMWENKLNILVGARQSSQTEDNVKSSKLTPQIGAVYRIPSMEAVSVYASYGESYRPNFNVDALGNPIAPIEEINQEAGVKVELFDGKVSGSASIYRLDQKNVSLRDYAKEAETGLSPFFILSGLARSEGMELDLVVSPTRNYQFTFSGSRIWMAKTLIAEDIRQRGVRLQGSPDYQFAFWNKYTFLGQRLSGAYLGLGLRWTSNMNVHSSWESPVVAKANWYGDMTIGYPVKLRKARMEFSLNVKNLFDEFYYNQTFRPSDPRQFFFSTNLTF